MPSKVRVKRQFFDEKNWYAGNDFRTQDPNTSIRREQAYTDDLLISSSHPVSLLGEQAGGLKLDLGGPFWAIKRDFRSSSTLGDSIDFSRVEGDPLGWPEGGHFQAKIFCLFDSLHNSQFTLPPRYSSHELDEMGTKAISKVAPTVPYADLSVAGGEALADGFPVAIGLSTLRSRAGLAKAAGEEYLNAEFGWKPLISDVRKMCHAVINAETLMDKYETESGMLTHKRYDFPTEFTIEYEDQGYQTPVPSPDLQFIRGLAYQGHQTRVVKRERRVWFKGVFTYYLPPRGSAMRAKSEASKLLGLRLTPTTLWNLAPWSWAVDWFGNVGSVLGAFDALHTDGLVMPWGYIMEESKITTEWQNAGVEYKSYPGHQVFRQEMEVTSKTRQQATPWGFGFDMHNLTARQWAIMVALGLTRGNRS